MHTTCTWVWKFRREEERKKERMKGKEMKGGKRNL